MHEPVRHATGGDDSVLVVIPCLNEARHIRGLLDHLLSDPSLQGAQVVVADGGSQDGSREMVAEYGRRDARVKLLHNPGRLQSAGVNLAVAEFGAGAEYVVRVDAHADYPPRYVSALLEEARRQSADSVVVAMETRGLGCFQKAAAAAQNSLLGAGGSAHRQAGAAGWVDHGHHALFRREAFVRAGGYDETFSHNEDAEFDLRLGKQGRRIWLTDRARLVYYPRETPGALWRQYLNYGRGRARTALKHRVGLKLRQAAPLAIAPAALLALAAPLHPLLAAPAAAWALVSLTFGLMLGLKARCGCAAASGFAAMTMHLAWSLGFWRQLLAPRPKAAVSEEAASAAAA